MSELTVICTVSVIYNQLIEAKLGACNLTQLIAQGPPTAEHFVFRPAQS